jgi:ABC-type siderophore export system fused ATPase/permease subunit
MLYYNINNYHYVTIAYSFFSIVKPTRCTSFSILFYIVVALYMFRTVFPSVIGSLRLYIQHQVYVRHIVTPAC